MDPTALLWIVQIAASHGTFCVILHFGIFCMSISNYECTIACDHCRAHPGNDSTLKRYAEIPLASLKERELLVSSLTAAARKPSICPLSKDSIVPSSLRRESELKRSSPVGQRLRRWALGRCLKPHRGEEARHRASLCGSWTTVGALPQFNCTVWKSALHDIKNTPNCQRAQPTQRPEAICYSIFGAVCLPAAEKGVDIFWKFEALVKWANQSGTMLPTWRLVNRVACTWK